MRKYLFLLLLLGFCFCYVVSLAQHASTTGTVLDSTEHKPIEFSTVSLHRTPDSVFVTGAVTDTKGQFTLTNLPQGTYQLTLRFLGYATKVVRGIQLDNRQQLNIGNLTMSASQQLLKEIVVSGQKATSFHQIDKQVYRAGQFGAAVGGTAVDVLKNLPSISVDALGAVSLRGSSGFLVLLNGKPVQGDASVLLSQLPANSIENVEIITTPSARYDVDGKAGIINITTLSGVDDGVSLTINALGGLPSVNAFANQVKPQRYGADATLNVKKGPWELSLGSSYNQYDLAGRRVGDVNTSLGNLFTRFPSVGERSTDKLNYSFRATASYTPYKANVFQAGFYQGNRREYRVADINYQNTTTELNTGRLLSQINYYNANLVRKQGSFTIGNLDYTHTFANKSQLSLSSLYERDELSGFTRNLNVRQQDRSDTLQYTLNTNQRPLTGWRMKADYTISVGKGKLELGYQYRFLRDQGQFVYLQQEGNRQPLRYFPQFSGRVFLTNVIHSLYSQYSGAYGKKLTYIAGLRYESADRTLRMVSATNNYKLTLRNLFPSASMLYQISDTWQAKAGYSRRVQRTTSLELNPLPEREHSETLEMGDPNLLPEFISLSEAGLIRNGKTGTSFLTLYYQGIQNVVNRVNSLYADTILNRIYTNAGNARRIGLEAGLDLKPTNRWKLYVGGNLYHYKIVGTLFQQAVQVNNASLVYSVNVNTSFQLAKTWQVQWNLNYLSRRATAQGEDSRFFTPNATLKKTFMAGRLTTLLQWQSMSMGLLPSNEQRITTWGKDFYTTTNYVYEKDVFLISLSYNLNQRAKKVKFTESEFGDKEF